MNVHRRSAHPESYHSERTVEIGAAISAQSKRRWDGEEEAIVALDDARLGEWDVPGLKIVAEMAAAMHHHRHRHDDERTGSWKRESTNYWNRTAVYRRLHLRTETHGAPLLRTDDRILIH